MKWIVDRIEEGQVICETEGRRTEVFAAAEMPEGIREGDVLIKQQDHLVIDQRATEERRADMQSLFDRLKKNKK